MTAPGENIEKYLRQWKLSNPTFVTRTDTSNIFEVSRDEDRHILKIFSEMGAEDEGASLEILSSWNGIGAVKLIASDAGAILLEKLEGPNLYYFSKSNQEAQATDIFIQIIRKLHSIAVPNNHSLPRLTSLLAPLAHFDRAVGLPFRAAFEIGKSLIKTQEIEVLLHGDLHHENVMMRKNGEYVCFDPKGFVGDPSYEIASILRNPWDYPEISENEATCLIRARKFSESLKLPLDRILKFAFVQMCLSVMWAIKDGRDYEHQLKIALFLEKHATN